MIALVPIPVEFLDGSKNLWWPYIQAISQRSGNDPAEKVRMLYAGEAQAFFVYDDEARKAFAFLGVRYVLRGQERQAELIWLMGEHRATWAHLFTDLQTYLRDAEGCKSIKAIARPGWSKILKHHGFRLTHLVMEKELQ